MLITTHRHLLQICIALGGLVPVFAGGWGMLAGSLMLGPSMVPDGLDSHIHYLSGLLFAMGLIFWKFIPTIERRMREIRVMTMIIFIGGLARLYAALFVETPPFTMQLALVMELVVTPALCLWQGFVARHYPV